VIGPVVRLLTARVFGSGVMLAGRVIALLTVHLAGKWASLA
jgi:hypothetical protein